MSRAFLFVGLLFLTGPGSARAVAAPVQAAPGGHVQVEREASPGAALDGREGRDARPSQAPVPDTETEEWGTETMLHHIVDSHVIEIGTAEIELPRFRPIRVAGLEIDMSPTRHVVFLFIAAILTLLTVSLAARISARTDHGREAPSGVLNFFEAFYLYLRDEVALANIGHGGERYVPYVVTLFFFLLFSNLLGLLPQGATPTSNIVVTGGMAALSLLLIEAAGYQALGPRGYLRTIFYVPEGLHPVMRAVMLVIMTPVEMIGKLAKPFALAVRLFANMTAGHFVILALLGLILTYGSFSRAIGLVTIAGSLGLGLFVMFLEIFVALLQAYIFTVLTAVFIGLIRHAH